MYDQEILDRLQATWPETTDYLRRVGQVQNDLMVLRELQEADRAEASWMDELAIGEADLLQVPSGMSVLRFLWAREIPVRQAMSVREYAAAAEEQQEMFEDGTASTSQLLEEPGFELLLAADARLWALPELQAKLTEWAQETATKHSRPSPRVTLTQATVLMRLVQYLDQAAEPSPEWAAELLRSALSSEFFEKAANPTK